MTSTNFSTPRESSSMEQSKEQTKSKLEQKAAEVLGKDPQEIQEKYVRPVKEKAEQARQMFQGQSQKAVEYSKQHPLLIGAAMFTAGLALGSIVGGNGRRHRNVQ